MPFKASAPMIRPIFQFTSVTGKKALLIAKCGKCGFRISREAFKDLWLLIGLETKNGRIADQAGPPIHALRPWPPVADDLQRPVGLSVEKGIQWADNRHIQIQKKHGPGPFEQTISKNRQLEPSTMATARFR